MSDELKRRLTPAEYDAIRKSEAKKVAYAESVGIFPPLKIEGPDRSGFMVLWGMSAPAKPQAATKKAAVESVAKAIHDLGLLDQNAKDIARMAPSLSHDHLRALLKAEQGGNTRKTVVRALEKALSG